MLPRKCRHTYHMNQVMGWYGVIETYDISHLRGVGRDADALVLGGRIRQALVQLLCQGSVNRDVFRAAAEAHTQRCTCGSHVSQTHIGHTFVHLCGYTSAAR